MCIKIPINYLNADCYLKKPTTLEWAYIITGQKFNELWHYYLYKKSKAILISQHTIDKIKMRGIITCLHYTDTQSKLFEESDLPKLLSMDVNHELSSLGDYILKWLTESTVKRKELLIDD